MNNQNWITPLDWAVTPFYIFIILIVAFNIQKRHIADNPIYAYFTYGLLAKIIGAIALCFVYVYYYNGGGDTIGYHESGIALVNLFFYSPVKFLKVLFGPQTQEYYSYFNNTTGFPYYWNDTPAFNVVKFIAPLEIIGMKGYLAASVLMAVVSFTGIWKLYVTFCACYPKLYKQFALSVLFIPSVCFWGSGILKDSWTIAAVGWYCYSFYNLFIKRERMFSSAIYLAFSIFMLILIKPYIFVGLLPGSLIWMIWSRLLTIKHIFLRIIVAPFIFIIGTGLGFFFWIFTSADLGEYGDINSMIQKAAITSEDLKQEYYQGNSFDIGSYDPTPAGMLKKFPVAVFTGLFRPFILEAKNPVMFVSGCENLVFLFYAVFFLLKRPRSFISSLFTNPLVLFCMIFGIFFAFSVAISTTNFGALVRLRIPCIPFFLTGLILVEYLSREKEKAKYFSRNSSSGIQ